MAARLTASGAVLLLWLSVAATALAVPPGFDLFETDPEQTQFKFEESFTIPADFFAPGSAPFSGTVKFGGEPLESFQGHDTGDADTIVQRRNGADLPSPFPSTGTVPIEIVQLNLQSVAPIEVRVGDSIEKWDVKAETAPTPPSQGSMTIIKNGEEGGTFSSQLLVLPLFTFERRTDNAKRTLDTGQQFLAADQATQQLFHGALTLNANDVPWSSGCSIPALAVPGLNDQFCPGFTGGAKQLTVEQALLAQHGIYPAQARLEHFKCYRVRALKRFSPRVVELKDQFVAVKAKVTKPRELCAPAKKNQEPIKDRTSHLMCHAIKETGGSIFKQLAVKVRNQFGPQDLTVVRPETLCLPSTKQLLNKRLRPVKSKPKARNDAPDHFKCYKIKGSVAKTTVTLKDQFGSERPKLVKPVQLCAPVQKNNNTIKHPVRHLVCYLLKEPRSKRRGPRRFVRVRHQFGSEGLFVQGPRKLCVPSTKIRV